MKKNGLPKKETIYIIPAFSPAVTFTNEPDAPATAAAGKEVNE